MSLYAGQSREQLRDTYREAWRKWCAGEPLQPLEAQIVDVLREHPEYHALLQDAAALRGEYAAGQGNPFLHLGLHLALREQLATDRPRGIGAVHQRLCRTLGSAHAAEHRKLETLAETLREAQRSGRPPSDSVYLERLRRL